VSFRGWDESPVDASSTEEVKDSAPIDIEQPISDDTDDVVGLRPIVGTRAARSGTGRKVLNLLIELQPQNIKPHTHARRDCSAYGDSSVHRLPVSADLWRYGGSQVAPSGAEFEERLTGRRRRCSQQASDSTTRDDAPR